jgi:nucleoside-diphosphate-sugar epimerase
MRVLITGAAGFLGRALVLRAQELGQEVVGTDIRGSGVLLGDLTDAAFIERLMDEVRPHVVIHAAALVPLTRDISGFESVNVTATATLARAARASGAQRFVLIGSSAPYGRPQDFPITSATRPIPIEPYGESKLRAETQGMQAWGGAQGFTVIRPRTILGDGRQGIFDILFRWIESGLPLPFPRGARHHLQLVHVDDVANLTCHLMTHGVDGVWPAGAPEYQSLREDLQEVISTARSSTRILSVPGWLFRLAGRTLDVLHLSPFTPWHYNTLDVDFAFDKSWVPEGFTYRYSNSQALVTSWNTRADGCDGTSAHTRRWPTKTLDLALRALSFLVPSRTSRDA